MSFLSWETIGADEFPDTPIVDLVPDLALGLATFFTLPRRPRK